MQSTGDVLHDAAIVSPYQQPDTRVEIDWPHGGTDGDYASVIADVTAAVAAWDIDRALATTLPAEARLAEGFATAELTLTLGGNETPVLVGTDGVSRPLLALLNPYNTASELYQKALVGRRIRVYDGMAGFTLLPAFTGVIRSIELQAAAGTVQVKALDNSEFLRVPGDLPAFVSSAEASTLSDNRKPGLNASWAVNYLARKGGFYTSPKRADVVLEASMHGSAWPELCTSVFSVSRNPSWDITQTVEAIFTDGPHGQALVLSDGTSATGTGQTTECSYEIAGGHGYTSGSIHVEGWMQLQVGPLGDGWQISVTGNPIGAFGDGAPPSSWPILFLWVASDRTVYAELFQNYGTGVFAGASIGTWPNDGAFHYFAVRCTFTSTGVAIIPRIDGVTGSTVTLTVGAATAPTVGTWHEVKVLGMSVTTACAASDVCVTYETGTPTWSNTFTPTATIDTSALDLVTIPPTESQDAYEAIQTVAGSEMAAAGFDEPGAFTYRVPAYFGYTAQRTISADDSLIDLGATSAVDAIRNTVEVPVQPYAVTPYTAVWEASEVIKLKPGQVLTMFAPLESPAFDIAQPAYDPAGGSWTVDPLGPPTSGFFANWRRDGTGRKVSAVDIVVVVTGDGLALTITSRRRENVYLVYPAGYLDGDGKDVGGQPALWIGGRQARAGDPTKVILADPGATTRQVYEAPDSAWRQTSDVAENIAVTALGDLESIRPQFIEVPIVPDPRLQLGDVVTLTDTYRLGLTQDVRIIGTRRSATPGQRTQTLDVRALHAPGALIWDVGKYDTGKVWG